MSVYDRPCEEWGDCELCSRTGINGEHAWCSCVYGDEHRELASRPKTSGAANRLRLMLAILSLAMVIPLESEEPGNRCERRARRG